MLVIGENGTGKKLFINTLCEQTVFELSISEPSDSYIGFSNREVMMVKHSPIRLNVYLTKNFRYNLNNDTNNEEIMKFLVSRFETKLVEESKTTRTKQDNLIHLVVFLMEPRGKKLKNSDISLIRSIQKYANVMVIITKGDLMTEDDKKVQKQLINLSIEENGLKTYDFSLYEEDPDTLKYLTYLQHKQPFTVINSNNCSLHTASSSHNTTSSSHNTASSSHNTASSSYQMRTTNFNIDIAKHSDFSLLRDIIFEMNLSEFKDITNNYIYERFRTEKLTN